MKEQLIFGSTAMKFWFPDFREPNDLDIILRSDKKDYITKAVQKYWIPEFEYFLEHNKHDTYLDPEFMLTLKMSHAGWDIHWDKTMYDILFLKNKGYAPDEELYKKLVKGWIKVHGKKWASLKGKDSETFFEDAVQRKYVHDDIHEAVAIYDRPLFEKLLFDGVSCSEKGFNQLSFEDKILLVKEEVWVTALERYLIPEDFKCNVYGSYMKALKKLATTMSSGWFKFFILNNYDKLIGDKSKNFVERFNNAVKNNKIKEIR
jgi:hypothetical protein